MDPDNLIMAGVELMLVGMATVFAFLTLLVGATGLMSRLATRWDTAVDAAGPGPGAGAVRSDGRPDGRTLAIITAAVHAHRGARGKSTDREGGAGHG